MDTHKLTYTQTQRHACTYTDKSTSRGAITVRQARVRAMHWCYITGWPGTAKHFSMWANNNSIWSAMCVCACVEKTKRKGCYEISYMGKKIEIFVKRNMSTKEDGTGWEKNKNSAPEHLACACKILCCYKAWMAKVHVCLHSNQLCFKIVC